MSRSARTLGIALVLAIAGAAGGYGVGALQVDDPVTISMALPVPAEDPTYPVVEYDVEEDPDIPALAEDLPLTSVKMIEGDTRLSVDVPKGWTVVDVPGRLTWNVYVPANPTNGYILRVTPTNQSAVSVTRDDRMNALRDAAANDGIEHLVFEDVEDDRFVATYLDAGYLRVAQERFVPVGGLVVDVSVVGRDVDRAGAAALQSAVAASLRAIPPKG